MNISAIKKYSLKMDHIRLMLLTVIFTASFTATADFNSTLLLANQGDANSQTRIGLMYEKGEGVTQSYTEAVKWYQLAANQGNSDGQYRLGTMYDSGRGVPKSGKESQKWYRLAVKSSDANYVAPIAIYENYEKIIKGAEQGNKVDQTTLGNMYEFGNRVPQSYTEAVKWYRLATDQGSAAAQTSLGFMYEYGKGVKKDIQQAQKWYRLAADQGDAAASNNLVQMEYSQLKNSNKSNIPTPRIYRKKFQSNDPLNIRD
jgi:TPR repeat protein